MFTFDPSVSLPYLPVTNDERSRVTSFAHEYRKLYGGTWSEAMKRGWGFLRWERAYAYKRNAVLCITFKRKLANVKPGKPQYTKRWITTNWQYLSNFHIETRNWVKKDGKIKKWYFPVWDVKTEHWINLRFDAVHKIHSAHAIMQETHKELIKV